MGCQRRAPSPRGRDSFIFMQFLAQNVQNNTHFGSWRPHPRKILDPPLLIVTLVNAKIRFSKQHFCSAHCEPLNKSRRYFSRIPNARENYRDLVKNFEDDWEGGVVAVALYRKAPPLPMDRQT